MAPLLAAMVAVLGLIFVGIPPLPDWAHARTISIVATEYRFAPDRFTLQVGVPYRLHLENRGHELHEFTAPAFLQRVALGNPEVLNADHTEMFIQPGEQKDLYLVPQQTGQYAFTCADHDWAGMMGEVRVEAGP
jgi:uncharacterized cupredoxin-like copper-binding protein